MYSHITAFLRRHLQALVELQEREIIDLLSLLMVAAALITASAMLLCRLKAEYGRYSLESNICKVPAKLAWFLQELPSLVIPCYAVWQNWGHIPAINLTILAMFAGHYAQRTLYYPMRIRGGKPTPLHLFLLGAIFTTWNGYIQGFYHAKYPRYSLNHLQTFRGIFGMGLFLSGMAINCHSDSILRSLRKPNEKGYKIPIGGVFELVSCGNFFGEIVEWLGYAIYAMSFPGWAFSLFTVANLVPRAIEHHRWYLRKFEDYPKERRAVIPFIL